MECYKEWSLLENCTYGDETCYLLVRNDVEVIDREYTKRSNGEKIVLPTITKVIAETYDGIYTALEDECLI